MSDLRLAVRSLRATPIVSAVAALSLALGIGANTAIFSIVDSLLLRTLPVPEPGRLVLLSNAARRNPSGWSIPVWQEIQRRPELFEKAAGWSWTRLNLATGGETQFINGVGSIAVTDETGGGGVAYMAHIGGFVAGVILIFVFENPKLEEEQARGRRRRIESPWD